MSPPADFSAEREPGDGSSTPKIRNGPVPYTPAVILSPAQQEEHFGVWPEWVVFRRFFPLALLAWWSLGVLGIWIDTKHKSFEQFSWASYTNLYGDLVSVLEFAVFLLGIYFTGRSISAWWTARRRIRDSSAATIRGVFGVQPQQSTNFKVWRYAFLAFFFAAISGVVWAGNTISKGSGFWPELIASELFIAVLLGGIFAACTQTFSKVLGYPATLDQQLRKKFLEDARIFAVPLAPAASTATPDQQLGKRLTRDTRRPTSPAMPAASTSIPSETPASTSKSPPIVVAQAHSGDTWLPSWANKLVKSAPLRWLAATICAAIINVLVARNM